jgi:hypothetical protein
MAAESSELGDGGEGRVTSEDGDEAQAEERSERVVATAWIPRVLEFRETFQQRPCHDRLLDQRPIAYPAMPGFPTSILE